MKKNYRKWAFLIIIFLFVVVIQFSGIGIYTLYDTQYQSYSSNITAASGKINLEKGVLEGNRVRVIGRRYFTFHFDSGSVENYDIWYKLGEVKTTISTDCQLEYNPIFDGRKWIDVRCLIPGSVSSLSYDHFFETTASQEDASLRDLKQKNSSQELINQTKNDIIRDRNKEAEYIKYGYQMPTPDNPVVKIVPKI